MKTVKITFLLLLLSICSAYAQINDTIFFTLNNIEIDTVGPYVKSIR